MKTELVQSLTSNFEGHAQQTETGVNSKTTCDASDHAFADHFADVGKMVDLE